MTAIYGIRPRNSWGFPHPAVPFFPISPRNNLHARIRAFQPVLTKPVIFFLKPRYPPHEPRGTRDRHHGGLASRSLLQNRETGRSSARRSFSSGDHIRDHTISLGTCSPREVAKGVREYLTTHGPPAPRVIFTNFPKVDPRGRYSAGRVRVQQEHGNPRAIQAAAGGDQATAPVTTRPRLRSRLSWRHLG